MSDFRGNIDQWVRQSEPDYYLFFLKAWIPFNAWYVAELPHLNKSDTKIIKELQDNINSKPRTIIETYLTNSDSYDAKRFRGHLADLHYNLETKHIKHKGHRLSFTNLVLTENPKKFEIDTDKNGNIYKAEVKPTFFQALIVDKGGRTFLDFKQPKFDINGLKKNVDFIKISKKQIQDRIINCYRAVDPDKPITLVSISKTKANCIVLISENRVNFIDDANTIAKGCIKVLYALRCMLFHGEIEPINANKAIYEHAYSMLRLIVKELI